MSASPPYRFGHVEVDPMKGHVRAGDEERHLRQKSFQVLLYLIENRDRTVGRDELLDRIWHDTAVTDDTLVQSIVDIRKAIEDDPRSPRFIKTVPKAGYRFIAPLLESEPLASNDPIREKRPHRAWAVGAGAVVVVVLVALLLVRHPELAQSSAAPPRKVAVAVLFFENRTKSAADDWLREGLADMLITGLSRSGDLAVISRQQTWVQLERAGLSANVVLPFEKALSVARASHAERAIVGSFTALGNTIRVDAQIHDVDSGKVVGGESLVVRRNELLSEIDTLASRLASDLGASRRMENVSIAGMMTNDLEAYRFYSRGIERAQALNPTEAIELFQKAVEIDPEFAMAYARIGYAYAVTWQFAQEAIPYFEKASRLSHRLSEKDKLYVAAWHAIAKLDFPTAIDHLRSLVARYPMEIEAHVRLAYVLVGEERLAEGIDVLERARVIDPESPPLENALGGFYSLAWRHRESIDARTRYLKLLPEEPNAHDSMGLSYHWAGEYEKAKLHYERALELNPRFEPALIHLANLNFQFGRYRLAIEQFQRYIDIAPSEVEKSRGYGSLAWLHRVIGDLETAERYALGANPKQPNSVSDLFLVALDRGDFATAEALVPQLEQKSPYTSRGARPMLRYAHYFRGYYAMKRGDEPAAIRHFKEALRHLPPTYSIDSMESCLADAYLTLGRWDEAIAESLRVLRLNPNEPHVRFQLARAYEGAGKLLEARNQYSRFIELWKDADADAPRLLEAKKKIRGPLTAVL